MYGEAKERCTRIIEKYKIMEQKIINKIQALIDGLLPEEEKIDLIAKIKADKELKMEFALLSNIKKATREKLKQELKQRTVNISSTTPAAHYLQQFEAAAFSKTGAIPDEDLPIDEDTIKDFMEGDSEE